MLKRDLSGWIRMSGAEFERRKAEQLARKIELFGTGADGAGAAVPRRAQPRADRAGRRGSLAELERARSRTAATTRDVDRSSGYVPAHVVGRVDGDDRARTSRSP